MATAFDNISSNLCPEDLIIVQPNIDYYKWYNHKYQKEWVQIIPERVSNKSNTRYVSVVLAGIRDLEEEGQITEWH